MKNALGSVFFNKGENCIAAGRLFVEETIYDEFIDKYVIGITMLMILMTMVIVMRKGRFRLLSSSPIKKFNISIQQSAP